MAGHLHVQAAADKYNVSFVTFRLITLICSPITLMSTDILFDNTDILTTPIFTNNTIFYGSLITLIFTDMHPTQEGFRQGDCTCRLPQTSTMSRLSRLRSCPHPQPLVPNPQPKPHTPHPKPHTLNPTPQIPHPKPQAPNPKPQTPDLKPQTPNHQPSTLNPYSFTLNLQPTILSPYVAAVPSCNICTRFTLSQNTHIRCFARTLLCGSLGMQFRVG